jgi:hypothetical protein
LALTARAVEELQQAGTKGDVGELFQDDLCLTLPLAPAADSA